MCGYSCGPCHYPRNNCFSYENCFIRPSLQLKFYITITPMVDGNCCFRYSNLECIHHLFFSCHTVRVEWLVGFSMKPLTHLPLSYIFCWLKLFLQSKADNTRLVHEIIAMLNDIWRKLINVVVHQGKVSNPQEIIRDSKALVEFAG